MIALIYQSYMDKKKYLLIGIYQFIVIITILLLCLEHDGYDDLILKPSYYQLFYEQLFLQVFTILNAMFVLFLTMDHDQLFFKPFYAYFHKDGVVFYKYIFHVLWIVIYMLHLYMIHTIIFWVFLPIDIHLDIYTFIALILDMFIILNMILIFIKSHIKSLAVVIVLFYMILTLFVKDNISVIFYIFPTFHMENQINMVELTYKICYIYLGFLIYMAKSLYEEV